MNMNVYYARRAPEYDGVYRKPERQADLRQLEAWLPQVFQGKTVLEVACGTGYWTQFIAPAAAHLFAMDASTETMEIAQTRVPADKVSFLAGDAYALPALTPQPDAAFAGFWLSHVPKSRVREFLGGLGNALQTGSRVVLIDNLFVEGNSTSIRETDAHGNTYQLRCLVDGSEHKVLKNFPSEQELRVALEGSGEDVHYQRWQYFWALEYTVTPTPASTTR